MGTLDTTVTALRGASAKAFAVATATAGSCTAEGMHTTAVRTPLRDADAEESAVATAAAGSCTSVGTLVTAARITLRGAETEASAVAGCPLVYSRGYARHRSSGRFLAPEAMSAPGRGLV